MNRQELTNLFLLLKDICKREKHTLSIIVVAAMVDGISPFISVVGMGYLVDLVSTGAPLEYLLKQALIIVLSIFVCTIISSRMSESFNQKQDYTCDLECREMNWKSLSMDYECLEDTFVQDLRSRSFAKSFYGIRGWYLMMLRSILTQFIAMILTLVILVPAIVESVRDTGSVNFITELVVLLLIIGVINIVAYKARYYYTTRATEGFNAMGNLYTRKRYYMDMLAKVESQKDLRIYNQQAEVNEDILHTCKTLQEGEREHSVNYIKRDSVTVLNAALSGLLIYIFVGKNAFIGTISIGDVVVFSASVLQLISAVSNISVYMGHIKNTALYAQDYLEFMNLEKRKYPGTIPVEKRRDHRFHVSFENVSFRYPGTEVDVIKNLTVQFEIGEKMAIVGKNGSGKSTFIKLLCRLYDVTEGCIKVNGIDIRMYNYQEYCALFAVVFQDFNIFAFSLGENIAGSHELDEDGVTDALQRVGLGDRLSELTNGLHTFVGTDYAEGGVAFSGGEKQKMAIARAIYKDAPFVIMDEPTAALDPLAECEVYAGFDQMVGKKTALYISHRLASCRFCEDILVFDKGQVVQRGSHEQLKEEDGIYKELWNAQAQYYA